MNGILRLSGRYIVKAWKRGELERWLGRGASLAEATAEAWKRNLLRDVRVAENLITSQAPDQQQDLQNPAKSLLRCTVSIG